MTKQTKQLTMPSLIPVRQQDIDAGIKNDCSDCPVAQAVFNAAIETFRDAEDVAVYVLSYKVEVKVYLPDRWRAFQAVESKALARRIDNYDRGLGMVPFTTRLHWEEVS